MVMLGFPLTSPGALKRLLPSSPHVPLWSFWAGGGLMPPLVTPEWQGAPAAQLWPRLALSALSERPAGITVSSRNSRGFCPGIGSRSLSHGARELLVCSFCVISFLLCNLPLLDLSSPKPEGERSSSSILSCPLSPPGGGGGWGEGRRGHRGAIPPPPLKSWG